MSTPADIPVADLLASGDCTPQCLLALEPGGWCACRCGSKWHGTLSGASVAPSEIPARTAARRESPARPAHGEAYPVPAPARPSCVMEVSGEYGACGCPDPPVNPRSPVPLCETHLRQAAADARYALRPQPWFRSEMAQEAISRMTGRAMEGRGVRADVSSLLACVFGCCDACNPLDHGMLTCHGCGIPLAPLHGWFGDDVYVMRFEPDGEPHAPGCRGRWTGGPHYGERR